jgi:hypothetical protein
MLKRWMALDERIAAFDAEFAAEAKRDEAARRLTSIPGIGALMPLRLSRPSVTQRLSPGVTILPRGSDLCLGRRRLEANRACSGLPNAAANTCGRC